MPAMTHQIVPDDAGDDWAPQEYCPRESDDPVPYEPADPAGIDAYPDDYEYETGVP